MLVKIEPYKIIGFNEISEITVYTSECVLDGKKYNEFVAPKIGELEEKLLSNSLDDVDYRTATAQILAEARKNFGGYSVNIRISIKDNLHTYMLVAKDKDEAVATTIAKETLAVIKKTIEQANVNKMAIVDLHGAIEKVKQDHKQEED